MVKKIHPWWYGGSSQKQTPDNETKKYCMNCKYFVPLARNHMGVCHNNIHFHVGYDMPNDDQITISGAVIKHYWMVGVNFGCIHFEKV